MFNASFASTVIIMAFIIVRGFQALALFLRYPHPKSLPSGEGTYYRPAGLYARSFASTVIIMTFIIVRGVQALALLLRYPHPKSLPSGKGLAIALLDSMCGVSRVLSCAKLFE